MNFTSVSGKSWIFKKFNYSDIKKYSEEYWDGSRKSGYGGYKYIKDYWKPVAQKIIKKYNLTNYQYNNYEIQSLNNIQELIKFVAKSGATEVDLEIDNIKIKFYAVLIRYLVINLNLKSIIL